MKFVFSAEVSAARGQQAPLVALESSVLAQGLPFPHNLEAAHRCEAAVRLNGAVPVVLAVVDGELRAGLDEPSLERLCTEKGLWKIGARDLCVAQAQKATGGLTVSATVELAAALSIRVFATGGIGGVHRGAERHFDVSQDLGAMAKWPVAVVSAGAKSVLDLPKTLELLETLGVPVLGVGTHELPGFYTRRTGLELEHSVAGAKEAALVAKARFESSSSAGLLFALPPPSPLPEAVVERHLRAALGLAKKRGISGKAVTPFLLQELSKRTKGQSLKANLELLENNARFAGELACALKQL